MTQEGEHIFHNFNVSRRTRTEH